MPAKLQGSVLCKLTLGELSPQKKQAPGAAHRCDAGGVFVAKRMILWYAVDAASAAIRCCLHCRWSCSFRLRARGDEKLFASPDAKAERGDAS